MTRKNVSKYICRSSEYIWNDVSWSMERNVFGSVYVFNITSYYVRRRMFVNVNSVIFLFLPCSCFHTFCTFNHFSLCIFWLVYLLSRRLNTVALEQKLYKYFIHIFQMQTKRRYFAAESHRLVCLFDVVNWKKSTKAWTERKNKYHLFVANIGAKILHMEHDRVKP